METILDINLSIGKKGRVQISQNEARNLYMTAPIEWPGEYKLKIWDSVHKNTETDLSSAISKDDSKMVLIWHVDPTGQETKPGEYYFEVFSEDAQAIILFGPYIVKK